MSSINVIANDTDVEGDVLSLTAVSTDGSGTVAINSDALSVDYTPAASFLGTEIITYTVSDGIDIDSTGTLTITGVPTGPTQSAGNNTTRLATTAFVQGEKASPTFTGTPAAPTAATTTNTTQIATTAFVQANTPAASQTVLGMAKIWTSGGDLYIATS